MLGNLIMGIPLEMGETLEEEVRRCPSNHCSNSSVKAIEYAGGTKYLGICTSVHPQEFQEIAVIKEDVYNVCGRHS